MSSHAIGIQTEDCEMSARSEICENLSHDTVEAAVQTDPLNPSLRQTREILILRTSYGPFRVRPVGGLGGDKKEIRIIIVVNVHDLPRRSATSIFMLQK